jgi:DNA mismatch repair protein MSH4
MSTPRPSTAYSYASTSAGPSTSYQNGYTTSTSQPLYSRPNTARPGTARPSSGRRSRAASTVGGGEYQQIICAISEGRGITPTVGLAFVNISTGEAVLSQICDNQFYARTLNKLQVFDPTEILFISNYAPPNAKSKMYQVVEENILGARIVPMDRRYWADSAGSEYVQQLAFAEDVEAIKVAVGGNYFALCCFAAVCGSHCIQCSLSCGF